jgi:hypothetical protein
MVTGKVTGSDMLGLPGASVYVSDASGNILPGATGVAANVAGFYSLRADEDQYITASFVSMKKKTIQVIDPDMVFDFILYPADNTLPVATITADKENHLPNWLLWALLAAIIAGITGAIIFM